VPELNELRRAGPGACPTALHWHLINRVQRWANPVRDNYGTIRPVTQSGLKGEHDLGNASIKPSR
jgi:hypothetical protein